MSGGGSASAQKIIKPGYHIRPKYDLHGLRRRRTGGGKGHIAGELPLTSMIDMFSILVIYLLMNFSATGEIFFMNKNLTLPRASLTNPMSTGPLISIIGDRFVLEAPVEYDAGAPVEDNSASLSQISGVLAQMAVTAKNKGITSQNRINVQAGEDTPIGDIKRAMTASVQSGWNNINFVVDKARR